MSGRWARSAIVSITLWPRVSSALECELIDRSVFENRNQARMAMFDYIEGFYNSWRRYSAIGNLCPVEYERRRHAEAVSSHAA